MLPPLLCCLWIGRLPISVLLQRTSPEVFELRYTVEDMDFADNQGTMEYVSTNYHTFDGLPEGEASLAHNVRPLISSHDNVMDCCQPRDHK